MIRECLVSNKRKAKLIACIMAFLLVATCARKSDLEVGIDALRKGAYGEALKSLRKALEKDSLNSEIHYNLCLTYVRLDSSEHVFNHYLHLVSSGSSFKDNGELRELVAVMLGLEPYPSSIIPMRGMNQFKGTFSPKGELIALAASRQDRAHIYLSKLDGSGLQRIIRGGMNTDPDFSPDGDYLVYVSDRDGDEDLYLYDIATKQSERLTDNSAQDFAPSFAPDSRDVVFVSNVDNPYKWEIYTINIKTKKIHRLTDNNFWDGFPSFTANGQSIVFSSKRDGSEDIYVMRRDGGAQELLFSSPADDNDPTLVEENLFFKSKLDGEWEIYRYDLRRKNLVRLTSNAWPDWNPNVSSDGTKLLVSRKIKKTWSLFFVNLDEPVTAEFIAAEIKNRMHL